MIDGFGCGLHLHYLFGSTREAFDFSRWGVESDDINQNFLFSKTA